MNNITAKKPILKAVLVFAMVLSCFIYGSIEAKAADDTTWQDSFNYEISGDEILLSCYKGAEVEELVIPAIAVIKGSEYKTVIGTGEKFLPEDNVKIFRVEKGVRAKSLANFFSHDDVELPYGKERKQLRVVDLRGLDTSEVTTMKRMFATCTKLRVVYIDGLDTSNVNDMSELFEDCGSLETLDLSTWDTSKVKSMEKMFLCCDKLRELNLTGFDTGNVENMSRMFLCAAKDIKVLDLSSLDMGSVTNASDMFDDNTAERKINFMRTPVNIGIKVELVEPLYDVETGDRYEYLPQKKGESILLKSDHVNEKDLNGKEPDDAYSFIERMYKVILGRDAEKGGIEYWTEQLFLDKSGADIARGFIFSDEYKNKAVSDEEYIKDLYSSIFNREASSGERSSWVDAIKNGAGREQVLDSFLNSDEFCALCLLYNVNPGVEHRTLDESEMLKIDSSGVDRAQIVKYVDRLYTKILGREADEEGLNYWVDAIMNGKDAEGRQYDPASVIAQGFFLSAEYNKSPVENEEFVKDVYLAFFDREPDEDGYAYWVTILNNDAGRGVYSRPVVIRNGFGHSTEFRKLLESYGFKVE